MINLLISRFYSLIYAIEGLISAFKTETNLRIHFCGLIGIVFLGSYLCFSPLEWVAIILSSALVIGSELLNTSLEKLSNIVDNNYNKQIKTVKDISAGAVLIFAISASIIGVIIILNHLPL